MRWPHDREAEYAVLGNSLHSADWHRRARRIVEPADFFYTEHQALFAALDQLDDLTLVPARYPDEAEWRALWPLTWPSSLHVRTAAVWTLGPYGAPLWALERIAGHASCCVERDATTVLQRSAERYEIAVLRNRIDELAR